MTTDTRFCNGCRNDFYNGKQNATSFGCWSLKSAKAVKRWRVGWWTNTDAPGAFTEVETYQCHHAPGHYAHYERLPEWAVEPRRQQDAQETTR